jgi:crossover junction endodeoxyribonuclease RusA
MPKKADKTKNVPESVPNGRERKKSQESEQFMQASRPKKAKRSPSPPRERDFVSLLGGDLGGSREDGGPGTLELELPWPPSANRVWRGRAGRAKPYLAKSARDYRLAVKSIVAAAKIDGLPLDGPLAVTIVAHPPDRRKRDLDNLAKSVFDALTLAGVWCDDALVVDERKIKSEIEPGGKLVIEIKQKQRFA